MEKIITQSNLKITLPDIPIFTGHQEEYMEKMKIYL